MVRIAGDDYPAEVVKSRFLKLNSAHIQYAGCRLPMVRMYEILIANEIFSIS